MSESSAAGSSILERLATRGISDKDYKDLIRGLFLVAPKDRAAHVLTEFNSKGDPLASTEVRRVFGGFAIVAADRGEVYAVWVSKIDQDRGTEEVVEFAQFPWGQI